MITNKQNLTLIDLDTITYIIAYKQWDSGNKDEPELVKTHVKEFISNILLNTNSDYTSMVYQDKDHQNFRKYFYLDYKSNRPPKPEFLTHWGDVILDEFKQLGAVGTKIIESDDVLNIGYNRFKSQYNVIIVSADKDLNQIPGQHYNPKKNVSYYVSEQEALNNKLVQILMGDSTDDVKGLVGIGCKRAIKLLEEARRENVLNDTTEYQLYRIYKKFYTDNWYSEYTKTKFLVLLLKEINYDLYPYSLETRELFNIIKCKENLVKTNLFI